MPTRRLVSPPAAELDSLRQPLTPGEKRVFEFFDRCLPEGWEIYLQPYLNGLRPDFVLLHPKKGIAVFEIKDWKLDASNYSVVSSNGKPLLMGCDGKNTFSIGKKNPVYQIDLYKKEIYELYCPRLKERAGFGVITAGVIFPFSETRRVTNLLRPFYEEKGMAAHRNLYPLVGMDAISDSIEAVFPFCDRVDNRMSDEIAADLRGWLSEPSFSKDQRSPLELSSKQRNLITTRTRTGYRRIRGSAGSGKSVVLAARASELASSGLAVLVCTFNITLINYLRDVSVTWKGTSSINSVTWLNFHYLCKRIAIESGNEGTYKALWKGGEQKMALNDGLADLLLSICGGTNRYATYDAILVDEGQDFRLKWWQALRKLLKPDGEMMLVADRTQDVYGTASAWTDEAMLGTGFRGEWLALDDCYRMPPKMIGVACEFAERFLLSSLRQVPVSLNTHLDLYPCKIQWRQVDSDELVDSAVESILELMRVAGPQERLAVVDVTVLVDTISIGIKIADQLHDIYSIHCIDTFERGVQKTGGGRRKKLSFFMGAAKVKLTTVQSFKGWEARLIVLVITRAESQKDLSTVYAGLTRLKRSEHGTSNLSIICSAPKLKSFPNFAQIPRAD